MILISSFPCSPQYNHLWNCESMLWVGKVWTLWPLGSLFSLMLFVFWSWHILFLGFYVLCSKHCYNDSNDGNGNGRGYWESWIAGHWAGSFISVINCGFYDISFEVIFICLLYRWGYGCSAKPHQVIQLGTTWPWVVTRMIKVKWSFFHCKY